MNIKSEILLKNKCVKCNKIYASASSLCNHKKKFHKNESIYPNVNVGENVGNVGDDVGDNVGENVGDVGDVKKDKKIIRCELCNKIFSSRFTKYEHKKKACKFKNNFFTDSNHELIELKKKNKELEKSVNELKELFTKIHPKTLKKLNKDLGNNITNNTIINNTINNTNITINKTYVNFNTDIDYKMLSENQILYILKRCNFSLEESIKTVHFNKEFPEYSNIFITNLKDNIAYIFDGNKFVAMSKDEVLNDLIVTHMNEIEVSAETYKNKINPHNRNSLDKFIENMNNNKKFYNERLNKTFTNFKLFKMELIKNLIYNNSDTKLLDKLKTLELINKEITYIDDDE